MCCCLTVYSCYRLVAYDIQVAFYKQLYKKILTSVILEILTAIINLYYTSLLSKIELSLLHMYCRDLVNIYISDLCGNLAFSTFSTI